MTAAPPTAPLTPEEESGQRLMTIDRFVALSGFPRASVYEALKKGTLPHRILPGMTRGVRLCYPEVMRSTDADRDVVRSAARGETT